MNSKFEGEEGSRLLHEAILAQPVVGGNAGLAREIAAAGSLMEVKAGTTLIEQGAQDDDMYLILSGSFNVLVNHKQVAVVGPGGHVGEMSPMQTTKKRTATVVASEDSTVFRLPEPQITGLAEKHPQVWRHLAKELVRRLDRRNTGATRVRERIRILVMAPAAGMEIAKLIEKSLEKDPYTVSVWSDGVFRSAKYSIEKLEDEIDESDFAIAVLPPDETDGGRENIIFDLGFLIGRLGRNRTLLLEPVTEEVGLPSDLTGLVTLGYRPAAFAPACDRIRAIVNEWGTR